MWESWWVMSAIIISNIQNDTELNNIAKEELLKEAKDIVTEYSNIGWFIIKKIKYIRKLVDFENKLNIHKKLSKVTYSDKILLQMKSRLWLKSDIEKAIKSPYKKWKSIDNYWWKNDPATVYFISKNQYVVINDKTWNIVQVSDRKDINWLIDPRIYDIK